MGLQTVSQSSQRAAARTPVPAAHKGERPVSAGVGAHLSRGREITQESVSLSTMPSSHACIGVGSASSPAVAPVQSTIQVKVSFDDVSREVVAVPWSTTVSDFIQEFAPGSQAYIDAETPVRLGGALMLKDLPCPLQLRLQSIPPQGASCFMWLAHLSRKRMPAMSMPSGDQGGDFLKLQSLQCEATELASELSSWKSEFTAKALEVQRVREEEACKSAE